MRCFIACFPTIESARALHRVITTVWPLPGTVRAVPPENYHLTLRFLGELAESDAHRVARTVAEAEGAPVRCEAVSLTGFPRMGWANAIAVAVGRLPMIHRWHQRMQEIDVSAHEEVDDERRRSFVPHVTIARSCRPVRVPRVELPRGVELELAVPALYRSESVPGGVRYRAVL